jgi:uncharacterized membrane protein YccF (DUF307 family)
MKIKEFNKKVATTGTKVFSNIYTFYLFFLWGSLAFLPLPETWKAFILLVSAAWLQLFALPLLAVGQKVLSEEVDKRAQEDHEKLKAEFALQNEELAEIRKMESKLDKILKILETQKSILK